MSILKNYINKKNLKRYHKVTSSINKIANEYAKKIKPEDIPTILLELKNNSKMDLNEKTKRAIALAKIASSHVLGMTYYDVQINGALALSDGNIAEMKTGEGKTLTCSAAVASNFVLGYKTHVITANEYLAVRDMETLKPLYEFMGISCAYNIAKLSKEEKQIAYDCDVLYSVATEMGFDYLRDNLVFNKEHQVQRFDFKNTKALIDEADFILIDEARTPMIISSPLADPTGGKHGVIIEMIDKLEKMAREPNTSVFDDAIIPGDFWLDEKVKKSYLSDDGYKKLEELAVSAGFINQAEELYYRKNAWLIREIHNALNAKFLYLRDRDYIVRNGEIVIIDGNTGRLSQGRSWSEGLNQAIEAKEGLEVKPENASAGSISVQNYFLMYAQISGMSGTIMTSSEEFDFIYNSKTIAIPKNKEEKRIDHPDKLFATAKDKYNAIIQNIRARREKLQPILLGTVSVRESEYISNLLKEAKIPHNVLNAKNHHYEAQIIAQAGKPGSVTVATSMAGRGTDIILGGNKESFKEIIKSQLSEISDRRQFFNNVYEAGRNMIHSQFENEYKQHLETIQKIQETENSENPESLSSELSNSDLLKLIQQRNDELNNFLVAHRQNLKELESQQALNHENVADEILKPVEDIFDEDSLLQQIAQNNASKSKIEEELTQSQAISQEIVDRFKTSVEAHAIEQGYVNHLDSDTSTHGQTMNESTVLTHGLLPDSLLEKAKEKEKPLILIGEGLKAIEFNQQHLDEASEIKKAILDSDNPMSQQIQIHPEHFQILGVDGSSQTNEVIDYHLVTSQLLMLFHPIYYTSLVHSGPENFNRLLNVLENTVLKEQKEIEEQISTWKEQVIAAGGLCVIGCSRNESRRIDNQLIGRAGRQGDRGESVFYLSLEDEWIQVFVKEKEKVFNLLSSMIQNSEDKYVEGSFLSNRFFKIQNSREEQSYSGRKHTFQFDSAADDARKGFLSIRNGILNNPQSIKERLVYAAMENLKPLTHIGFFDHLNDRLKIENIQLSEIKQGVFDMPLSGMQSYADLYMKDPENNYIAPLLATNREIAQDVKEELLQEIQRKANDLTEQEINELAVMSLQSLDQLWTSILNSMDEMNQSVGLRQIAQKNPIYEFKNMCFELFTALIEGFNDSLITNYEQILEIRKNAIVWESDLDDSIVEAQVYDDSISLESNDYTSNTIPLAEFVDVPQYTSNPQAIYLDDSEQELAVEELTQNVSEKK